MSEDEFMDDFNCFIKEKVQEVKNKVTDISFQTEKKAVATCPFCGKEVYKYQKKGESGIVFYCGEKDCCFSLSTEDSTIKTYTRKALTEKRALQFIANGKITLKCFEKMGGREYKREFLFVKRESNGKVYCNVKGGDYK